MKLFPIDYIYIVVAAIFLFIFSGGLLLDEFCNRKPEHQYTVQKQIAKCEAFIAVELNVSGDKYTIIHHIKYADKIGSRWGDATIYPAWNCEAKFTQ